MAPGWPCVRPCSSTRTFMPHQPPRVLIPAPPAENGLAWRPAPPARSVRKKGGISPPVCGTVCVRRAIARIPAMRGMIVSMVVHTATRLMSYSTTSSGASRKCVSISRNTDGSADLANRNPRHRIQPISVRSHKVPNAMNPCVDMDVSLGSRSAGIKSFSSTHCWRARDVGTQFIVRFGTRVIGWRKQQQCIVPFGAVHSIDGKKTVVGGNQHGRHTDVVELAVSSHHDRRGLPRGERSTGVGYIEDLRHTGQ